MIYQYQAYRTDKQVSAGTIEATSERLAEEALYEAGFQYILSLRTSSARQPIHRLLPTLFGVKTQDVIDFSRQLAAFLAAGSSLLAALQLLEEQIIKPALKEMISGLIKELQAGKSFSQALNSYPDVFPHFYWQVIKTSEKAGDLENGLKQIADYMETRTVIANRIKRALAYPLFVVLLAIGVLTLLMTMVLPPMLRLFTSFKAELPTITVVVINVVNFLTTYKFQLLIAIIAIIGAIFLYSRFPSGKRSLQRFTLSMPVVGPIVLQRNLGNFCRTTSMLLKAGLPLPEIMEVVIETTGNNQVFIQALIRVREKLLQGEGFARPMTEDHLFPRMMVRMVTTGEQTGTFESVFSTLADYYEGQTDQRVKSLITWIEPALTVIIGLLVALMLFSIIMPIYQIIGTVR